METLMETPREQLLSRLDDPEVAGTLNRLIDQLPLLAFGAEAVSGLLKRGDTIADNIARQMTELKQMDAVREAAQWTDSIPGLMKAGSQLADTASKPGFNNLLSQGLIEELGKPERIDLFKRLLDKLELIVFAVEAADGFLRRSDSMMENVRNSLRDAGHLAPSEATLDRVKTLAAAAPNLLDTGMRLLDSGMLQKVEQLSETMTKLLASGLLEPANAKALADLGTTMTETLQASRSRQLQGKPPAKAGLFDLLGAMRDPGVQATMGLLVEFSKRYGEKVQLETTRNAPRA